MPRKILINYSFLMRIMRIIGMVNVSHISEISFFSYKSGLVHPPPEY
jgi:hypothetical protein